MSKKKELEAILNNYKDTSVPFDSNVLNNMRTNIFALEANGEIVNKTKVALLKSLYSIADDRGIFYMRVTDKKAMPVEEVAADNESENDDYSDSYSEEYNYS